MRGDETQPALLLRELRQPRGAAAGRLRSPHGDCSRRPSRSALENAPDDPRGRVEAGLRAFVETQLANARGARVTYLEIVGVSLDLERHRRAALRGFAQVIEREADLLAGAGALPPRDHALTAMALGGAVDGLLTDCFTSDDPPATEAIVTTLVDLFVAAFTAPA